MPAVNDKKNIKPTKETHEKRSNECKVIYNGDYTGVTKKEENRRNQRKKRALTHTPHMYGVRNLQEFSTLKIKAFLLSLCLVQTPLFYNAQFY